MTKSMTETTEDHKTIGVNTNEKCHKMQQLMLEKGEHGHEIRQLIDALQKIGYFESFRVTDNQQLGGVSDTKTQERKLKTRRKARYRKIRKYYKSPRQYQKERLRRKLCFLLSGKYKESEIADMLGISRRTVIRDMNRIKPYYFRMTRAYFSRLEQERIKEMNFKLQGKTLWQRFNLLTEAMIEQHERFKTREYRGHYTILHLDMTQTDKYGIPKFTLLPRQTASTRLAYPHKVRVMVKGCHEGREFTADIGGFNITQTSGSLW